MNAKKRCRLEDDQQPPHDVKKQRKDINCLDYDSLAHIFMLLPIPERMSIENVCPKWKEACQLAWWNIKKYKCEPTINRTYNNPWLNQLYVEKLLSRCGIYLKELSLSKVCNSSIMPMVADYCNNLTRLEFVVNKQSIMNTNDFIQAFKKLNNMQALHLKIVPETEIYAEGIIHSLPKEIHEIHLIYKPRFYETHYMNFQKFKNLKCLTLRGFILDKNIQEISKMKTLVHLDLRNSLSFKERFDVHQLVNLEHVCVLQCPFVTNSVCDIFNTCNNLKYLDVEKTSYCATKIVIKNWANLKNLKNSNIEWIVSKDFVENILKYGTNLESLNLSNISNKNLLTETLLCKLTQLKNLELLKLPSIRYTKKIMNSITNNCEKLKYLFILCSYPDTLMDVHYDSSNMTVPASIFDELSKLEYIEHLHLSYVKELQDSTIIAIVNNCKNLKCFEISNCKLISKRALMALTSIKKLEILNVSFISNVTDIFIRKLKGLKSLICRMCKNISDAGVIPLIKNCPDLDNLDLGANDNITIDTIIAADEITKNRTNNITLEIFILSKKIVKEPIIKSQWLIC